MPDDRQAAGKALTEIAGTRPPSASPPRGQRFVISAAASGAGARRGRASKHFDILNVVSQRFVYEFAEEKAGTIHFDYSADGDEQLSTAVENGTPVVYANRSGLLTLAKLLIKMSAGPHSDGFHVHLHEHFNADRPECLTVMLVAEETVHSDSDRSRVESESTIIE